MMDRDVLENLLLDLDDAKHAGVIGLADYLLRLERRLEALESRAAAEEGEKIRRTAEIAGLAGGR